MNSIEKTGKTVELAIESALKTLGVNRDEVEVEIVDVGSKGILGLGAKPATVKVTVKFDPEKIAQTFIKDIGMGMGILIDVKTNITEKQLDIVLSGENMGILIGKRGQTLDALQYLVSLAVNKGTAPFLNVVIDSENYRKRRKESLEKLALNIARKVKATRKSVTLEPMNTFERRIIHATLQGDRQIATHSEGNDPYRNIVIAPRRHG
ncbi:MAG: protein jag [Clostridiales bacterium]|jgi:spoIIIJ-associated protein|nr:protein jag [Clostridiales bacterium]